MLDSHDPAVKQAAKDILAGNDFKHSKEPLRPHQRVAQRST